MFAYFVFIYFQLGHSAMVELLLAHGAQVNAVDREQRTPLQSAAWQGHETIVWHLLRAGARADQPCSQGATPLSIGIWKKMTF